MRDDQYTPDNLRLVGEWMKQYIRNHCIYTVEEIEQLYDPSFYRCSKLVPELIREALARDGVYEARQYDRNDESACYFYLENESQSVCVALDWNIATDPTARHALFAATVEYLKWRKG